MSTVKTPEQAEKTVLLAKRKLRPETNGNLKRNPSKEEEGGKLNFPDVHTDRCMIS